MKTTKLLTIITSAIVAGWLGGGTLSALAQTSVGVHFVSAGGSYANSSSPDALAPTDLAGVSAYAQANWNNFGAWGDTYGIYGTAVVLTDSAGAATSLSIMWDSTSVAATGADTNTADGKLMSGFIYTYSPGAATPFGNNPYSAGAGNKPLAYVGGLNAWCGAQGAIGYKVVLYTTGYAYNELVQGYVESASGQPQYWGMTEGLVLTPYLYAQDGADYSGTYVPTTSTSSGSPTYGANYMEFDGLSSDAILIRLQCPAGYGAGMNGFQIIPVFAAPGLAPVGVHFGNGGGTGYADGSSTDLLAPTDSAGISGYAQANWNNLGASGDSGIVVLTDSTGAATSLSIMRSSAGYGSTGTATNLGTADGKLMDGYLNTYSTGAATALGNSVYYNSPNNNPLAYIGGLNNWCQGQGAAGYDVVIYTTGNTYYETAEGFLESIASGDPFSYNMVEGDVLQPPLFAVDTANYSGTYNAASGTSLSTKTYGANYMVFHGLTNDAILIRLPCIGYGAGLSGFQLFPQQTISQVVAPVVTLNSAVTGSTNVLTWSAGTLQTATNLLGPWTYNYTPSPVSDIMTNTAMFYRVWVQK